MEPDDPDGDLVDDLVDAVTVHDREGRYIRVSRPFEVMTGLRGEDLLGSTPYELDLFHPDDVPKIQEVHTAGADGEPWRVHYRLRRSDDTYLWVESAGRFTGERFVVSTRDAAGQTSLLQSLGRHRELVSQLVRLTDERRAFLTAVAHRTRTPLTAVLGFAEVLADRGRDLPAKEYRLVVDRLHRASQRLAEVVERVTEATRLSNSELLLEREPLAIVDIVAEVMEGLLDDAHPVHVEIDPGLLVLADRVKLGRAVGALLANAIVHTPIGTEIWIAAETTSDGVVIGVEDAGPGVSDEMKRRVFDPFHQGGAASHDPGMGLGLHLVAEVATLHGGRVWVEDREGGGAAFRLALPATRRDLEPDGTARSGESPGVDGSVAPELDDGWTVGAGT